MNLGPIMKEPKGASGFEPASSGDAEFSRPVPESTTTQRSSKMGGDGNEVRRRERAQFIYIVTYLLSCVWLYLDTRADVKPDQFRIRSGARGITM